MTILDFELAWDIVTSYLVSGVITLGVGGIRTSVSYSAILLVSLLKIFFLKFTLCAVFLI